MLRRQADAPVVQILQPVEAGAFRDVAGERLKPDHSQSVHVVAGIGRFALHLLG